MGYPGIETEELRFPEVQKKLDISDDQKTKLQDIFAQSLRNSMELSKLSKQAQSFVSIKQQEAKGSEITQKLREFYKRDHEQIVAVLTPRQLMEFRKFCIQQSFLQSLVISEITGHDINVKDQQGILNSIKASPEQIAELCRLNNEVFSLQKQNYIEKGEKVLKILSPQCPVTRPVSRWARRRKNSASTAQARWS